MSRKRRKHRPVGPSAPSPAPRPPTPAPARAQQSAAARPAGGVSALEWDEAEPTVEPRPAPGWLFALLAVLLYVGDVYLSEHGADLMGKTGWFSAQLYDPYFTREMLVAANPGRAGDLRTQGQLVFEKYCQQCHQANGLGVAGQFPPLAGSEWVLAEGPGRLARIVLNGMAGPVTVKGAQFNNNMFAFRDLLSDEEIAAVLTFIRSEWGNAASAVQPDQIKRIRQATTGRATQWAEAELLQVSPQD